MRRRGFLVGAGLAALGVAALPVLPGLWHTPLPLVPLERPAGFRYLSAGPSSGSLDPLVGLTPAGVAAPHGDLCAELFGAEQGPASVVRVASFSDYNCPFCRVLTRRLIELQEGGQIRVHWHELPLLGPASEQAARGALAAERQGRYADLHERLMQTSFQPTDAYLKTVGDNIGLDGTQLLADMDGAAVTERLERSRGLARLFGIVGTPAVVVGRTLVQGEVGDRTLRRLIALEQAEGPVRCA